MTQDDLLDYLKINDCHVYETRNRWDGIAYFMRRNGCTDIAVLFKPKKNNYRPVSVCQICETLGVSIPDYAKDALPILESAKKSIPPELL